MTSPETSIRLRFGKVGAQRLLSHLDLMRLFHRAFRRALLPLAVSRGKSPRPRISIPYPLPVGVESDCEILEAGLEFPILAEELKDRLNRCLPEGVAVRTVRTLGASERHELVGTRYAVEGEGLPDESRLCEFRNSPAWKVDRRKNERLVSVDIRPYVRCLERRDERRLELHLGVAEGRSTRPDEVLAALGLDAPSIARLRVVRCGIIESAGAGPAADCAGPAGGSECSTEARPDRPEHENTGGVREAPGT